MEAIGKGISSDNSTHSTNALHTSALLFMRGEESEYIKLLGPQTIYQQTNSPGGTIQTGASLILWHITALGDTKAYHMSGGDKMMQWVALAFCVEFACSPCAMCVISRRLKMWS